MKWRIYSLYLQPTGHCHLAIEIGTYPLDYKDNSCRNQIALVNHPQICDIWVKDIIYFLLNKLKRGLGPGPIDNRMVPLSAASYSI